MSLQIWLPLNGNLDNKGFFYINESIINNGATVNDNGKIGKCYYFNNNTIVLPSLDSTRSICFWLKAPKTNSTIAFVDYKSKLAFGFNASGYIIPNCTGLSIKMYSSANYLSDQWNHIAVIKNSDDTDVILYINGVLQTQRINTNNNWTNNVDGCYLGGRSTGTYLNCYINDFRVYDHSLSAKEVEEIAKALVLHYKLNNNGFGNNNLALNTHDLNIASSKNNLNMSNRGNSTIQLRTDGFYESKSTASWQGLSFWANQLNLSVGDKITYSFYIYCNGNTRAFSFYPMMFNSSGTRDTSTKLPISIDGGTYTTVNSKTFGSTTSAFPEYHYVTFEWNQAVADIITNGGSIELSIQVHGTWNSDDWACLFAPKVEYGEKPTDWSPAPEDLGIDTNIIYDCSGYENNGFIIGTLSSVSNSPRYDAATLFAASSAINCGRGGMVTDSITVNLWAKYSSYSNLVSCTESGGWNMENNSGLTFPIYIQDVGYVHVTPRPAVANYANKWHMFTGVYDRINQQTKLYIDGELIGTGTVSAPNPIKYHASNVIWLNAEATGSNTTGSYGNAKQFSDFRIYATALSDAAIKELYNTSASIDYKANVYAREFDDINVHNKSIIEKTGQFITYLGERENFPASLSFSQMVGGYFYEY